jgi:hypothetical protein
MHALLSPMRARMQAHPCKFKPTTNLPTCNTALH